MFSAHNASIFCILLPNSIFHSAYLLCVVLHDYLVCKTNLYRIQTILRSTTLMLRHCVHKFFAILPMDLTNCFGNMWIKMIEQMKKITMVESVELTFPVIASYFSVFFCMPENVTSLAYISCIDLAIAYGINGPTYDTMMTKSATF